jgi:hypothetical protein
MEMVRKGRIRQVDSPGDFRRCAIAALAFSAVVATYNP